MHRADKDISVDIAIMHASMVDSTRLIIKAL